MEPMVSAFWNAISEVKKPCAIFLHPSDYNKLREQWVRTSTGPEYLVSLYDLKYPEEGVGAVKVGTLLLRPGALAKHEPGGSIDVLVTGRSVPGSIPEGEFVVWGGDFSVDREGHLKRVTGGELTPYDVKAAPGELFCGHLRTKAKPKSYKITYPEAHHQLHHRFKTQAEAELFRALLFPDRVDSTVKVEEVEGEANHQLVWSQGGVHYGSKEGLLPPSEEFHKAFALSLEKKTIAGKSIHTTLPGENDPRDQIEQASKESLDGFHSAMSDLKAQSITHTAEATTSWQWWPRDRSAHTGFQKSVNLFEEGLFNYRAPNLKFAPYVGRNENDWSSLQVIRDIKDPAPERDPASEKQGASGITDKNIYNEMMGIPNDQSVSQLVRHALDGMTNAAEERGFLRGIEEERKLHQEAGTITSTAQLTWDEIQEARAAGKLFVSADHCGSVPTDWLVSHRASGESKREEMGRVAALETQVAELTEKLVAANRTSVDLAAELDEARMRLVACSVVAMSNTPKSAGANRKMAYEYSSSPAVQDVMHAVDREMALRADLIEAQAKIKELEKTHERTSEEAQDMTLGEYSEEDSSKGFGAILGVIGAVAAMAGAVGVVAAPKGSARLQGVPQEEEAFQEEEENSFESSQTSG